MKDNLVESKKIVNELLVDIFNRILIIEAEFMKTEHVKLSMNEIHVLEAIVISDPPTMTNIANKLHITVGSLTTSINTLFQKKYVIRERDPNDRRKVKVFLTDISKEVLKKHDLFHEQMLNSIFDDLNVGEDILLIESLRKLSSFFSK